MTKINLQNCIVPGKGVADNAISSTASDTVGKFISDNDYLVVSILVDVPLFVNYNFYCGHAQIGKICINDSEAVFEEFSDALGE